ncbi:MAG: hypothetical protein WB788_06630 [Thermoplasmata archaeon]|nr:hypothetical protein [Thermoplasmata archaeon]
MCDWNEAEYAEYLLWVESARAREREWRAQPARARESRMRTSEVTQPIGVEA